ncbi:unnamed protein product [Rotaria magnacalcarata]|uniref:TH1 domain-containing protein n=1 Tax=Rotaria magnacalcarata TaxID=392030 RepID=A0A819XJR6_9BILA|nr:unnamed protein product [Rotaria magnacalcarata]CAF2194844.1 unnamed protein product [Rotaria magnacalcarata]CAF4039188.1 unnamed protein product [Rotaria magnacalcarata]CAF4142732.1 unnamed protein product [Rotaria magnacalcarata]
METELLPNVRGTVQSLRSMWSEKVRDEQNILKQKLLGCGSNSQQPQKKIIKDDIKSPASTETTKIEEQPKLMVHVEKSSDIELSEKSSSNNDADEILSLPAPPASAISQHQTQSLISLQQSVMKLFDIDKTKAHDRNIKTDGIRHWHLARHVFRSGLVFSSSRRASDSIIPLLMKTRNAQCRHRAESVDSIQIQTPFQNLIDYISYNNDETINSSDKKPIVKRTTSDTTACIQRNKLNDTIAQYEAIMRHLKNYDTFMITYPISSTLSLASSKPTNKKEILKKTEEYFQQNSINKSSIRNTQTQSLARSAGRTFTEFIMNDLLSSNTSKTSSNVQTFPKIVDTESQTEPIPLIETGESIRSEEANQVIEEFNNALIEFDSEIPITANSEINVIIVNPVDTLVPAIILPEEQPLMQRLFEGKKTAYSPDDLNMETKRIPEELMNTFKIATKKCFLPSEQILYAAKMIKIDRRGYKQRLRILCITTERLYIITKKNPYPKEHILFKDMLGIICTPCKDGFICVKTREMRDDRGDWLFLVDHPCEVVTQMFIAMGRDDNNDKYLKLESKFQHTRRSTGAFSDDGTVEARPSETFHIEYENYETLVVYTP